MLSFILKQYKVSSKKFLANGRYYENQFVLMNVIMKFFTFIPAFFLAKIKVSPDTITVISYFSIIFSSGLFLIGQTYEACFLMILFLFFDSLDGDLARLYKVKSDHGQTMDIFGADLFYILIPFSISYNLAIFQNVHYFFFEKESILIIGFLISFCLIFYRLIGLRNYLLFTNFKSINKNKDKQKKKFSTLKSFFDIFEHDIIRGNFFSEPGFVCNFSILIFLKNFQFVYYYLLVVLFYHIVRTAKLFIGTIIIYIKK